MELSVVESLLEGTTVQTKSWGKAYRHVIPSEKLIANIDAVRQMIYRHHSSFDYFNELTELGFPKVAHSIRELRNGNPDAASNSTRMGNLSEILASEYSQTFLEFNTTLVFPKRFNPNVNQSMKGSDVIGIDISKSPVRLLLGEAKGYSTFNNSIILGKKKSNSSDSLREAITTSPLHSEIDDVHLELNELREEGAIDHLRKLSNVAGRDAVRLLYHWRETIAFTAHDIRIDRVFEEAKELHLLLFILTKNNPVDPFKNIDRLLEVNPMGAPLNAVHVQILGLDDLYQNEFGQESQVFNYLFS